MIEHKFHMTTYVFVEVGEEEIDRSGNKARDIIGEPYMIAIDNRLDLSDVVRELTLGDRTFACIGMSMPENTEFPDAPICRYCGK